MSDTLVTIVGNVCKEDPTLKFTASGLALCEFSVRVPAQKARPNVPAREAEFHRVVAWRQLAENVAESVRDGDRVIVQGYIKTEEYDAQDGTKKTSTKLNAWNVGLEVSFVTATVNRTEKSEPAKAGAAAGSYGDF